MSNLHIKKAIRSGWDAMANAYQLQSQISTNDVHYAPFAPGERDLGLLDDVAGKSILELACGSAQNSIALARLGAKVVGLDISSVHIDRARKLSNLEGVDIELVLGDMEFLPIFADGSFDIVLSSFGFEFVPDLLSCIEECHRILKADGLLIISTTHPLSAFEWDEETMSLMVTDYFNLPVEVWQDYKEESVQPAMTFFHTIEEMFDLLTGSGFSVERLLEPAPYSTAKEIEEKSPYAGPYWNDNEERLKRVPFAVVYAARKR